MIPGTKVTWEQGAKFIVALCGFLVVLILSIIEVFTEWLPEDWALWLASAASFITAIGVFVKKNAPLVSNFGQPEGTGAPQA